MPNGSGQAEQNSQASSGDGCRGVLQCFKHDSRKGGWKTCLPISCGANSNKSSGMDQYNIVNSPGETEHYNFVGIGAGSYDKVAMQTTVSYKLRTFWLCLFAISLVVFAAVCVHVRIASGRTVSESAISEPSLKTLPNISPYDCQDGFKPEAWESKKRQWCCIHEKKGCTRTPAWDVGWDCKHNLRNWFSGWSYGQKSWCCEHENVHCDLLAMSDGVPVARPTNTKTTSAKAGRQQEVKAKQQTPEYADIAQQQLQTPQKNDDPCNAECVYQGWSATCQNRILWSAVHTHRNEGDQACGRAHSEVMEQCRECNGCSVELVGCLDVGKVLYNCKLGSAASEAWPAGKKTWCCMHENLACPTNK